MSSEGHGHDEVFDPKEHQPTPGSLKKALMVAVVFVLGLLALGIVPRLMRHQTMLQDEARQADNPPVVAVTKPERGKLVDLSLPGTISPFQETVVYARVNGYLRNYRVDIGDRVKRGQVIADIETPDLDQQLKQARAQVVQARADVEQAKSRLDLARVTNERYAALLPTKFISPQAGDEAKARMDVEESGLASAQAALQSAEANAQHLSEMKNFATLVAPFDGVITSRTTEEGQLVTVGMSGPQEVFKVARTDVMRLFINVPQLYVPSVKTGDDANVIVREFPNRVFVGKISRTTRELDPATRTLVTQIDIPNPDDALVAGMYARAALPLSRADVPYMVPSTALVFNAEGTRVAVVEDGKIHWKNVQVDGDTGPSLAVSGGLDGNDRVVVSPSVQLAEGLKVKAKMVDSGIQPPSLNGHAEGHPVDAR